MITCALFSLLNDENSPKIAGGFANPTNKGKGSTRSGDNGGLAYLNTPSGVANSNHFFNQGGDGRVGLNDFGFRGQGQLVRAGESI